MQIQQIPYQTGIQVPRNTDNTRVRVRVGQENLRSYSSATLSTFETFYFYTQNNFYNRELLKQLGQFMSYILSVSAPFAGISKGNESHTTSPTF